MSIRSLSRVAPAAILAAAFAHNLDYTWRRWGDPVIDGGRELEVARQVAAGQTLYADMRWFHGPLAPYLNGTLFRIFGVHAGVLMTAGAVSAALMAGVLYLLARRFAGRIAATLAATAFLYLCAFGHYYWNGIFNWVLPYSYAATYGMLTATTSLYLLVRYVQTRGARDLQLSVACLALTALGKVEAFVPATAAHLVFIATERPRPGVYIGAAGLALGVYGAFWLRVGSLLLELPMVLSPQSRRFALIQVGLTGWQQASGLVLISGGAVATVIVLVWGAVFLERSPWLPAWASAGPAALCALGAGLAYWRLDVFTQFRALPLLLAGLLFGQARRSWRSGPGRRSALPPALVWVFALACLARILFATGAFGYGFYLLPVPLLAFVLFWFEDLPTWLPGRPTRLAACAGVGVLLAVVVAHHRASRVFYNKHNTLVSTPRGRIYLLDDLMGYPTGKAYADTVQLLEAQPRGTRVLIIPEGVGLAFLAGLESICGQHSLLPPELNGPFEDRLLACLEASPPDLVVRVGVNLDEYGSRGFGEDYAERIAAWILSRYEPAAEFGPGGYMLVLRRRAPVHPLAMQATGVYWKNSCCGKRDGDHGNIRGVAVNEWTRSRSEIVTPTLSRSKNTS